MKVIVVGAGIAGLTAAWDLSRAGRGVDVLVLESERRPGGVIVTEPRDGFLIEGGPDGWVAAEPELPSLAAELGLAERVVPQQARGSSLWTGQGLEPLEEGRAAQLLGIEAKGSDLAQGFRSFAGGMAEPVLALAERLAGSTRFAQGVTGIAPSRAGWRVALTGGSAHDADAVVLALPAFSAGRLLEQVGVTGARALGETTYLPSTTVSLAYRATQLRRALEGTGFVSAPTAGGTVRACTYASAKYPGRAPDGHVLFRTFVAPGGGDGDPAVAAHAELAGILGIDGAPLWSRVYAWPRGIPRYRPRHVAELADVRERLARLAPLAIAGAGYDGAGVSACVRSGREAAHAVLRRLGG